MPTRIEDTPEFKTRVEEVRKEFIKKNERSYIRKEYATEFEEKFKWGAAMGFCNGMLLMGIFYLLGVAYFPDVLHPTLKHLTILTGIASVAMHISYIKSLIS